MSEDNRTMLTGGLWFLSAVVLVALFISAAAQGALTPWHIFLVFVFLGLAVAGTVFLSRTANIGAQETKAKRGRLDNMLDDLSDDELIELKRRLSQVDTSEGTILDYVGDDGEMVLRD